MCERRGIEDRLHPQDINSSIWGSEVNVKFVTIENWLFDDVEGFGDMKMIQLIHLEDLKN